MEEEKQGRDARDRLVADITRQIAGDPSLLESLTGRARGAACPPKQLCCPDSYHCPAGRFECLPEFTCGVRFASIPLAGRRGPT